MKKGYVAFEDDGVIAAGVDEEAVKAWVFDFVLKDYDLTEIDEILEELDYQSLDDLRMDMVSRGFDNFWDYLGIELKEAVIIGAD